MRISMGWVIIIGSISAGVAAYLGYSSFYIKYKAGIVFICTVLAVA